MGQIDKVLDLCSNQNNQSKQYNDSGNRGNTNSSKGKAATPEVSQPKKPKRMNAVDRFVQAALRIGAVQILFEHVPHHAAVKETVDVLKQPVPQKHQHAEKTKNKNIVVPPAKIKYVNAVLRRLTREGHELLQNYTDVMDNAAPWFVDELVQAYGPLAARGVVQAAMEESPRCLTVKPPLASGLDDDNQIDQAHVHALAQLHFSNSTILPQGSLQINNPPSGKISDWPLYEEGAWWLQDVSATIPALALHSALRQRRDEKLVAASTRVVDLCAAPGGKTLQLCTWGYQVTAIEVSPRRSNRLGENVERVLQVKSDSANSNCKIVVADGCEWTPHEEDRGVHGVLIDAPCTATGTGSKRPDVLRKKQDYRELLETQYNLLCHAADHILAPGGVLVYATCSLLPQESEHQIQKFLARDKDDSSVQMRLLPFQAEEIPGFEECIDDKHGWLRIVPGSIQPSEVPHLDGFFVARLERVA
jgi:16S rRNA (cytosine967-C5)-methyltransferase